MSVCAVRSVTSMEWVTDTRRYRCTTIARAKKDVFSDESTMSDPKMTAQPAKIHQHNYISCPACGDGEHRVDHLYDMRMPVKFGPWYCNKCGAVFAGEVIATGNVSVWPHETRTRFTRSMALLKLDGKGGPVFFVMDHARYHASETESDEENQKHQRYYFEEHSCPTNWLRKCVAVIQNGDWDPHGFLDFVRAADVPRDFDTDDDSQWENLFPEAFDKVTIDGSVSPANLIERSTKSHG